MSKTKTKNDDEDECELLIDEKVKSYDGNHHHQHQSSRFEWAEASWTRYLHVLFVWWVSPILSLGYRRSLTIDDLDELPHNDRCSVVYEKINVYDWTQTVAFNTIVTIFWKPFLLIGCLLLPYMAARIAQPLLLSQIILHVVNHQTSSSISTSYSYFYAIAFLFCVLIQAFLHQLHYIRCTRLDLMIQNSLISMIYNRLLSMNTTSLQQMTTAHIVNLIANDATKFEDSVNYAHFLWEAPVEAVLNFGFLCWIIGFWPTLYGYIVFILCIPLLMLFSRQYSRYHSATVTCTDKRIHAFKELITGRQVIKIYHWEKSMEERVRRLRQLELISIRRASLLRALNMGLLFAAVPLIGFATYIGAWLTGYSLKATNLFIALTFYSQMRSTVMHLLPLGIEKLSNAQIAWKRIDAFIKLTITQQQTLSTSEKGQQQKKGAIIMRDASFSWHGNDSCLSSLNIDIEPGTFVGIAGPIGSGKSSFFSAILGEMIQKNGQLDVNDSSFSYAVQSSWIFADTLRANILLGKPFDEQRYMRVIHACCLDVDLNMFGRSKDLTIIGENGVNLSGGQKARVSLARALYVDADIYLLDDPLAAVDCIVANHIYDQYIGPNGLLSKKTRLLITHQTEYLMKSHQTILFDHGHIRAQGHFDELIIEYENLDRANIVTEHEKILSPSMLDIEQSHIDTQSIIVDETSKSNTVNWSVWYSLLAAPPLGLFGLCLLIVLFLIGQIFYDGTNLWISLLLRQSNTNGLPQSTIVYIYFTLTMTILIIALGRAIYFFYHILNGTNHRHNKMLTGLLYTSMRFFESNPSGRILNRVSKDQQVLDEALPKAIISAMQSLTLTVGPIIVIGIINPWILFLLVPLTIILLMLYRFYSRSNCQLKRLESVTRSPVYALFTSSFNGLATIRAFKVKDVFLQTLMNRIDANTRVYINMIGASRWFALRVDLMTNLLSFVVIILTIMLRDRINPSLMTLSLMYSVTVAIWFQWGTRQLAEAENFMTSAERIDEYAQLPREEDDGGSKRLIRTPAEWPKLGAIEFRNYSLRYRPGLELALKNISFTIMPGEKIGIIGRTGAGKSSLFQGLLRLVDRSAVDGVILIDDIDISRITLSHLRSHLSVIPQQSMLFAGTLRYNLDPFDEYSDEQCWMALEAVQLKKIVSRHLEGLLMPIVESGSNLSVGQCQLICVARAVLKQSKILLIDEATANIDKETDQLIQSIIAEQFQNRTVLTIAHRLNTVANSNRLLVLDRGTIIDFDIPDKILPRFQ